MTFSTILTLNYNISDVLEFKSTYAPANNGFSGTSVSNTINFAPLYNGYNERTVVEGEIQFNNIEKFKSTFPPNYSITEQITIKLANNTSIFAYNTYKSTTGYYPPNTDYILPIVSCTGDYVGRTGYIVIHATVNNRQITVGLF